MNSINQTQQKHNRQGTTTQKRRGFFVYGGAAYIIPATQSIVYNDGNSTPPLSNQEQGPIIFDILFLVFIISFIVLYVKYINNVVDKKQ